jgi:hypothetical protein
VIGGCVSTGSEIVVSRVLILIRASLIAVTPRLIAIRPRLILITRRLIVIRPRLILITRRVVGIIHGAIPHQMKRTGDEFAPHRRLTISRPSSSPAPSAERVVAGTAIVAATFAIIDFGDQTQQRTHLHESDRAAGLRLCWSQRLALDVDAVEAEGSSPVVILA